MNWKSTLFLALLALLCQNARTQTLMHTDSGVTWANTITAEDLSHHLYILASDSMAGRETEREDSAWPPTTSVAISMHWAWNRFKDRAFKKSR